MKIAPARPPWLLAAGVVAFSLVSKLALALSIRRNHPGGIWHPDSYSYQQMALGLRQFGIGWFSSISPDRFEAHRPLGYPLALTGLYSLTGVAPYTMILVQAVLSTLTVLLAFRLGQKLFSARTGFIAALLLSLDIETVGLSQMLLSETLFGFLLLAGLTLLVADMTDAAPGSPLRLPAAGLTLALATFVRPVSYYLIPALAVLLLMLTTGPKRLLFPIRFLLLPALLVGGWQVGNQVVNGVPQFSGMAGVNMLFYRGAGVKAMIEHRTHQPVMRELGFEPGAERPFAGYFALHPDARGLNAAAVSRRWWREGFAILRRHPGVTARVWIRGLGQLLADPGAYDLAVPLGLVRHEEWTGMSEILQRAPGRFLPTMWQQQRAIVWLSAGQGMILLLVYLGVMLWLFAVRSPARFSRAGVLLVVVLLYFLAVSAGPEATGRLRAPVMPLILLFGVAGWLGLGAGRKTTGPDSGT
jgi:4-amino-4-deoxy-L-arabinose transferase-like glycosyltransferase